MTDRVFLSGRSTCKLETSFRLGAAAHYLCGNYRYGSAAQNCSQSYICRYKSIYSDKICSSNQHKQYKTIHYRNYFSIIFSMDM